MAVRAGLSGRERDLAEVDGVLAAAAAGRGQVVAVLGEAGIGKTWMAEAVRARAAEAGMQVAWAGCPAGTAPPFFAWRQLLRRLAPLDAQPAPLDAAAAPPGPTPPPLARLLNPAGGGAADDPEAARLELFEAVVDAVGAAAAQAPALLVVDDAHWADAPSIRLLAFVAPALRTIPAVVLLTARADEAGRGTPLGDSLPELLRHGRRVDLAGLSADELAALAEDATGAPLDARAVAAVAQRTGGNPLFARELVRLLHSRGELPALLDGTAAQVVPQGVRDVLRQRLARLGEQTTDVLDVAAATGERFGLDVLQQATGLAAPDLLARLQPAVDARLVVEEAVGRYAFAHALFRAALEDAAGLARRVRLHQRIAEALEALDARGVTIDPADLAHHWTIAAPGGNASRAVAACRRAAAHAQALLAYEQAARLHGDALAALDLAPADAGVDRAEVLLDLAEALVAAGRLADARQACADAAVAARASGRGDLLARAALAIGGGAGGFEIPLLDDDQIPLLEEALAGLDRSTALRAQLLARLSVALANRAPVDQRTALAEEAVAVARAAGDPVALAHALAAHCDAIAGPEDVERRRASADEIVALARRAGDRRLELLGRRLRLVAMLEVGDLAATDAEVGAYDRVAATLRQPLYQWYPPLWRGMLALARGDVDAAAARCDEAERVGTAAQSFNARLLVRVLRWGVAVERGDADAAADAMTSLFAELPPDMALVALPNHALSAAHRGDLAQARRRLDEVVPRLGELPVDAEWLAVLHTLVEAVFHTRTPEHCAPLHALLLPHRDRHAVDGIGALCYGSVERCLGVLAGVEGRRADAKAHFTAALAGNERAGAVLAAARTQLQAGALLGDHDLLADARRRYATLGLDHQVAAAQALLGGEPVATNDADAATGALRRRGELWEVSYEGRTVQVTDRKGLHDLARLLAAPGREVHVLDLVGDAGPRRSPAGEHLHVQGDLGPVVDARARRAYGARLSELDAEVAEAEAAGDGERAARARAERDVLSDHLAAALGLGGRARRAGDPAERARSTVTRRIREAIAHLERGHPRLGRHLRAAVRTGTTCRYDPERPTAWEVAGGSKG